MGITEQWNMLAGALRAHVCIRLNGLPLPEGVLDPICAPFGALVVLHRWGEHLPAYLDPNARGLMGLTPGTMDAAALLQWYVGQRDLMQGRYQLYADHFARPGAALLTLCTRLSDTQGQGQWYCGICGVLCAPGGGPVILTMLFPLEMMLAAKAGSPPDAEQLRLFASLSARERDVLQLLGAQWRSDEVAAHLNISTDTVASHRKSLLRKLGARTIIGLAPFAALMPPGPPVPTPAPMADKRNGSLRFGTDNGFH